MNLILYGMGEPAGESPIEVRDALTALPARRWSVVLSNPPFGRTSSLAMVGADGREAREDREIERQDFVVTTSNEQLDFVQHIRSILDINGRAAVVLPDKRPAAERPWTEPVVGPRPADQLALHAQAEPAAPGASRRLRDLVQAGAAALRAGRG